MVHVYIFVTDVSIYPLARMGVWYMDIRMTDNALELAMEFIYNEQGKLIPGGLFNRYKNALLQLVRNNFKYNDRKVVSDDSEQEQPIGS